mgnify:CR=1 FL=1
MFMKTYLKLFVCVIALLVTACSDEFFEVNQDPNGPTRTTPENMLPNVIQETMHLQDVAAVSSTSATNQLANTSTGSLREIDSYGPSGYAASLFQNNYFWFGINNEKMMEWAQEEGSYHYVGVAKILKAINFAYTLDTHGTLYYQDAFDPQVTQHTFDDGEFVYNQLLSLLDEAIIDLDRDSFRPLSQGDILYNGDVEKWKMLAYAEKARILNHLTKKSSYNPQAVLAAVDNSFKQVSDEAAYDFTGEPLSDRTQGATGGFGFTALLSLKTWDKVLVDYLKGEGNGGIADPRLSSIVNPGSDGQYRGVTNGVSRDGLNPELIGPVVGGFYSSPDSKYFIFSYEELKLIEAEAAFLSGDVSRAYTAYQTAIRTNMERMAITASEIEEYLTNNPAAAVSASALTLGKIMFQKYVTMVFHPEVWVDMRRYDYDPSIYPGFSLPDNVNSALNGEFIRRIDMFNAEIQFNKAEVERIGGLLPDYKSKRVWWDQP